MKQPHGKTTTSPEYAIVDLGSNSFHLVVAKLVGSQLRVLDRMKEVIKLGEGLQPDGSISPEHHGKAVRVLTDFGQRIKGFESEQVRVIGTSALRNAKKAKGFIDQAESLLGFPLEVISGQEEARLIYLGVTLGLQAADRRQLVIDIGGGSTELILGKSGVPTALDSIEIGNISLSKRVFGDNDLTTSLFLNAVQEVDRRLLASNLLQDGIETDWEIAIGASGTMRAMETILKNLGLVKQGVTRKGLETIIDTVIQHGGMKKMMINGLNPERAGTFPGALAILFALFQRFNINYMQVSQSGIREGLLYDLAKVSHFHDRRSETLLQMMDYYGVDKGQAQRIEQFIQHYLPQITPAIELDKKKASLLLTSAAKLHEIGKSISFRGYHKHGAYIARYTTMPGFTKREQGQVGFLILNQRKRLKTELSPEEFHLDWGLVALFRLAHLFNRHRNDSATPIETMSWDNKSFTITMPKAWLDEHPLFAKDLNREKRYFKDVGVEVLVNGV
ncbi:Ppx/GppA family phosphatase [bacterium]|nr:Ppx/GppA family phosphatase [bacterium]